MPTSADITAATLPPAVHGDRVPYPARINNHDLEEHWRTIHG